MTTTSRARPGLQIFLGLLGSVALVAGAVTVVFGATSVVGVDDPSPAVDSEMRFFAAWYAAAGILLLRAVSRIEAQGTLIRAIAVVVFMAGCSRGLSWIVVGRPPVLASVLMVIELALPFVVIPWQKHVETRTRLHPTSTVPM